MPPSPVIDTNWGTSTSEQIGNDITVEIRNKLVRKVIITLAEEVVKRLLVDCINVRGLIGHDRA